MRARGGQFFTVGVAMACGLAGAIGAVLFRLLIRFFQELFFAGAPGVADAWEEGVRATPVDPRALAAALPPWQLALIPAAGGLLTGLLLWRFARDSKAQGVPEVMEAVALRGGVMRLRSVVVKMLASVVSIGSGGSVGREGPIVHFGSAIGSALGQALRLPARQLRTLVGCGAAAGIAATFNAPIAGALFAVEVIVGDFAVAQFSPIVISAVVATVVSRWLLGNSPAFEIPVYEVGGPFELLAFMGVGLLAGLIAVLFIRVLYRSEDAFRSVPLPVWLRPALGGLLVGALALAFPHVLGVGYGAITDALTGSLPAGLLALLLFAKLLATSVSLGSGGSGGVFAPSLFLGAMLGGLCGQLLNAWLPEFSSDPGLYALVAMGALGAATTHAPVSAILIIFELTQRIDVLPPVMAAAVVSTLLSTRLSKHSIYTLALARRGVDLQRESDPNVLKRLYVSEILHASPQTVHAATPFEVVIEKLIAGPDAELFVVDRDGRLRGAIRARSMLRALREHETLEHLVVAGDLMQPRHALLTVSDDLDLALRMFSSEDVDEIPVVDDRVRRTLIGCVHKRDEEVLRRDLAGGVQGAVAAVDRVRQVELGGGFVVQELPAPARFVGRTLRELELRARFGVQVLLLRSTTPGGQRTVQVPGPGTRVAAGDKLVVAGRKDAALALAEH